MIINEGELRHEMRSKNENIFNLAKELANNFTTDIVESINKDKPKEEKDALNNIFPSISDVEELTSSKLFINIHKMKLEN